MADKSGLDADGKILGAAIAAARKKPVNFAMLMARDGLVVEADPRKPVETLRRAARSGGGGKGVWGTMRVEGSRVVLTCEEAVPGGFQVLAKRHFSDRGQAMQIVLELTGETAGADAGEPAPEEEQAPPRPSPEGAADEHSPDTRGDGDEDDEDDLAAEAGDLEALMRALRKRPYNFAWLLSSDGAVMKAHKRRPVELLIRQAKSEGATARGGWGQMTVEGKSLVLACVEDPPTSLPKRARLYLKDRGLLYRVIARGPSGELADDEETEAVAATADPLSGNAEAMRTLKAEASALMADLAPAMKAGGPEARALYQPLLQAMKAGLGVGDADAAAAAIAQIRDALTAAGGGGGSAPGPAGNAGPPDGPRLVKASFAAPAAGVGAPPDAEEETTGGGPGGGGGGDAGTGGADAPAQQVQRRAVPYAIPVTRVMDNLEFSNHVDMVARGMTRAQAEEDNRDPRYRVHPLDFVVTEQHVKAGSVLVIVYFNDLGPVGDEKLKQTEDTLKQYGDARRNDVNAATDALFWEKTNYKPGEKLDPSDPNFKAMSEAWKAFRADVVDQERRMDRIPPEAKRFFRFRAGGVPVTADNIDQILAIAEKVRGLSDEAIADYWARATHATTDIAAFAASVDRYLAELAGRQQSRDALDTAHNALVGKKALFETYDTANRAYLPASSEPGMPPDEFTMAYNAETFAAQQRLKQELADWGYPSEDAFEKDIEAYTQAFQTEAVNIANDAMDRRLRELAAFESEVLTGEGVAAMFDALADVRAEYARLAADPANQSSWVFGGGPDKDDIRPKIKETVKAAIARDPGLTKLFELRKAENPEFDLDDEMIDLLTDATDPSDLRARIMVLLEERRDGIATTRKVLAEDPEKIWAFDAAIARAGAISGVMPGSVQEAVIKDKVGDEQMANLGRKLAIGGLAIVAGLFTFGEGTVVVLGGAAALGLGAYDAWDTYTAYVEEHAANKAGLTSADPSFAWVVVSLATLPLDVLGLASGIRATAKAAHIAKLLEAGSEAGKAVRSFNAAQETVTSAEDVARALARLEQDLGKADKAVRAAVMRAARIEAEANAAWAAAKLARGGRVAGYIDPLVTPLLDLAAQFAYPVCMSIRKGVARLDAFLKTRYATDMIKGVDALSPEAVNKIAKAYEMAVAEYKTIARRAVDLGMSDAQLDEAFKVWAKTPDMPAGRFVTDVLEPMAKARSTVPAYDAVLKRAETLPGGAANLTEALTRAAADPAYAKALKPHLAELRREIEGMDKAARGALPESARGLLDDMGRDIGEQLLRDADIPTPSTLHKGPPAADLDPARVKAMSWNHEQKVTDLAEGIGGARLEKATGRPITSATEEGADLMDGADLLSLKGPLLNSRTGAAFPINDKMVEGLAKSVVKDLTTNTATKKMVVDMLGLTSDQRILLQSKIAEGLKEAVGKGLTIQNAKPIIFLE
ncbi:MAG: hypothetical protein KF887_08485 [Paracoccaceae bacterium]|nr:MAG: hypothetical protein KF887_08485 [Paracoccaceae bacterium]